jgi:hypothetical protein
MKPLLKRRAGFFEDRSGEWIDMPSATITSKGGTTRHAVMFGFLLTLLALGNSTRPALLEDVHQASVIIRKFPVEILRAVPQMLRYRLLDRDLSSSWHWLSMLISHTCCQGIITLQP